MLVDGKSVEKTQKNDGPSRYENVRVWATQGIYYPASKAKIKELKYEQKILFSSTEGIKQ